MENKINADIDPARLRERQDSERPLAAEVARAGGALLWLSAPPAKADTGGRRLEALFPFRDDQQQWLRKTCRLRSPEKLTEDGRWSLPPSALNKVVAASLDEFGVVGLFQDVAEELRDCAPECMNAEGLDCVCGCLGENHGGAAGWVTVTMTGLLPGETELGHRRMYRRLTPVVITEPTRSYAGELDDVQYTTSFKERRLDHWPRAAEFDCLSCTTSRAEVWDHCHTHGFVRAPLCDPCNTWMWSGHEVPPRSERVVDLAYYKRCPGHRVAWKPQGPCSA